MNTKDFAELFLDHGEFRSMVTGNVGPRQVCCLKTSPERTGVERSRRAHSVVLNCFGPEVSELTSLLDARRSELRVDPSNLSVSIDSRPIPFPLFPANLSLFDVVYTWTVRMLC